MLAWSNGKQTHLSPQMMHLVEQQHLKRLHPSNPKSFQPSNPTSPNTEQQCRQISREYERYSDELWELDLHVESYKMLLLAASSLLRTPRNWISRHTTSWYHDNLKQFRRLFHRCRQRARQDSRLAPLLNISEVKQTYERMLEEYAECNISDRIKVKDWGLWDDIWQWDGDDPLCD